MSAPITTHTLDWRGVLVEVRFEERKFQQFDHLQIQSVEPERTPLPMTETGYRSHFVAHGIIQQNGGPLEYAALWLDQAATDRRWIAVERASRQLTLF